MTSNCYINERETPKTCLTNHKGSISHHIMLLVINSLGGGHTHTSIQTSWKKTISRKQSHAGLWLVCDWFKNNTEVMKLKMQTSPFGLICKFYIPQKLTHI